MVDKNHASSSTRPDTHLKRKKPGGGPFVAWPPLARPRENVIVLDDSDGEQEWPALYKVRDVDKCSVFGRVQDGFSHDRNQGEMATLSTTTLRRTRFMTDVTMDLRRTALE